MIRIIAFVCGLLLAAPLARSAPPVEAVSHVVIPVSHLGLAVAFYTDVLGFEAGGESAAGVVLQLGRERIALVQGNGRPYPTGSRSNDLWFQHLAIVVSDIDRAYAAVRRVGAAAISTGPQLLPAWNPTAGGIRAVYFRDPDGRPLELIQYPPGKGDPRWQAQDRLFLGIDHTAIAASDTTRSVGFYRDRLGLRIAGGGENWGVEQERLSGVPGARVRITTLRAADGPGVELLHYLAPGDGRPIPGDSGAGDLWAAAIVMRDSNARPPGQRLRDPDGHAIYILPATQEVLR